MRPQTRPETRPAIRQVDPRAHRPALMALYAALQDHEREMEPNRLPGEACGDHVDMLIGWAAEDGLVLLVEDEDGPGAFLLAGLKDEGGYVLPENRVVADVSDLYVAPRLRRRGLALALLRAAEAHFAAQGVRRIEIGALARNESAVALYRAWAGEPYALQFARVPRPG